MSLLVALLIDSYQLFAMVAMKVVIWDQLSGCHYFTRQPSGRCVGCSSLFTVAV